MTLTSGKGGKAQPNSVYFLSSNAFEFKSYCELCNFQVSHRIASTMLITVLWRMFIELVDNTTTLLTEMVQAVAMLVRQYCCSPAEAVDYGDVRELKKKINTSDFNIGS